MPRQLLISQARPRSVFRLHLPLEQFSQQIHRIAGPALRQTQIGRQLPHRIVFRILTQHKQIFFQRLGGLPLLQKFFRALDALGHFGSVRTFCDLGHG
jgi:hypothetical protein